MAESFKKKFAQFSALQWTLWSAYCTFGGFIAFYLTENGYSNTGIGLAFSALTFTGVLGQLFWGYICDWKRTTKWVFIICTLAMILVVLPFPLFDTLPLVIMGFGLFGFVWNTLPPVLDSWVLQSSEKMSKNYGITRAAGSVGFAIVASFFGTMIETFGWNVMFTGFAVLAGTTVLLALFTEDSYARVEFIDGSGVEDGYGFDSEEEAEIAREELKGEGEGEERPHPLTLFQNFDYVFLIIVSFILFLPFHVVMRFMPVIIKSVGGTPADQGLTMFVTAISEVPLLLASKYLLERYRPKPLLIVATTFYTLRIALLILAGTPQFVIAVGALQSLSFGVFLPTTRHYINDLAPKGLKTTAQTIAGGIYFGVGGILAGVLGGMILDRFGVRPTLIAGVCLSSLAVLLLVLKLLREANVQTGSLSKKLASLLLVDEG